ncbi:glycosyltransferase [Flexivirga caeni]|uniref:D-inositol 3-phosphate glycosyltransferase n=1 Tax=Flexivirga caeni TaxID=2294115 RepID=A0A3M9LV96_9MICO|nr:glycosyltransferase [Flexivirga caeni]
MEKCCAVRPGTEFPNPVVDTARTTELRIIPELRAAHVERHAAAPNEVILYRKLSWDLGDRTLPNTCRRASFPRIIRHLASANVDLIELPEPLWVRALPLTLSAGILSRILACGRARNVTYAIENNDIRQLMGIGGLAGRAYAFIFVWGGGFVFRHLLDKIAYGSAGAASTYSVMRGMSSVAHCTIPELPKAATKQTDPAGARVLFVGRLERRKGMHALLKAWPGVELRHPAATLTIVGDGDLRPDVQQWQSENPEKRHFRGLIDHREMSSLYRTHSVLVAPSQREGRWREQIGLPIKEALSFGMTVVSTAETGLAQWLKNNGHYVIDDPRDLEDALTRAVSEPLHRDKVLRSLPELDGRSAADRWLRTP